jgi:hypothetical protein
MPVRRAHRVLGVLLFLPFLGWAASGLVFFLKPGYGPAYASLELLREPLPPPAGTGWLEERRVHTRLGEHLLVKTNEGWQHLHADTLQPWPRPSADELRPLIAEAIAADTRRYGAVASVEGDSFVTTTGARIELDWKTLQLSQRGRDTDRIDAIYRVHYLQWTGLKAVDKLLGLLGLGGVAALALLGLWIALHSGS